MGGRYAFLRSGRWLGLVAGGLAAVALFSLLGRWQYTRYEFKVERAAQVEAAWAAPALSLEEVLAGGLTVPADLQWRALELRGEFLAGSALTLRNRPVEGTPAAHVLALFLAEHDGGVVGVVVDRGWLPAEEAERGAPQPPAGAQQLTVRLRVDEAPVARQRPARQVYAANTGQVLQALQAPQLPDVPVLQGFGQATAATAPLRQLPLPDTGLGSHLSYAFQWWFFAAAVPLGLVVLARREAAEGHSAPALPRQARPGSAEAQEDALIESQLRERPAAQ